MSDDQLADLAIWTERTYLARLEYAKRLQLRGSLWSAALIFASAVSAIASIALLVDPHIYGRRGDFVWAAAGVIVLVASLVVAGADYSGKARNAFEAYREFQRISVDVRHSDTTIDRRAKRKSMAESLNKQYQQLLDRTANHSGADFAKAMTWHVARRGEKSTDSASVRFVSPAVMAKQYVIVGISSLITLIPIMVVLLSVLALVPVVVWSIRG